MSRARRGFRVLSPTAILGYGFPQDSFMRGMERSPDLIAVDAGSVDPGPYYLGAGVPFTDAAGVKRDLRIILREGIRRKVPVVVGTAGGSGAKPHLEWTWKIVREILRDLTLDAKVALIHADMNRQDVLAAWKAGKTQPLAGLPELSPETLDTTPRIVAQMGVEPFQEALRMDCDVVLAGRAYDPAVFAALPLMRGYDPGLAVHMGKILECAAIAAQPGSGADCVLGELEEDSFLLSPLSDQRRFTTESVAAHSLYEKSDPYRLPGPGGHLDLRRVTFQQEGECVRVSGSEFVPSDKYLVKLEGARLVGYRTISVAGTRDPVMIDGITEVIESARDKLEAFLEEEGIEGQLHIHVYGRDGVMAELEPIEKIATHELCILIEAVASTQSLANTICSITRSTMLHHGYPGRISTAGNLAFPFSPSDIKAGPVYEFSIYHLMEIDDPYMFKVSIAEP